MLTNIGVYTKGRLARWKSNGEKKKIIDKDERCLKVLAEIRWCWSIKQNKYEGGGWLNSPRPNIKQTDIFNFLVS